MIKVSTRGRYGLRVMLDLAQHYGEDTFTIREVIAEEQGLSKKYIHNLLMTLRDKGLVKVHRGKRGGFKLAKHPSKIKVLEILETLEGPIALVDCVLDRKLCSRSSRCLTINLWEDLGNKLKKCLGSITLESFIKKYSKRVKPPA